MPARSRRKSPRRSASTDRTRSPRRRPRPICVPGSTWEKIKHNSPRTQSSHPPAADAAGPSLPRKRLCTKSHEYPVVPGCRIAAGPEPIFQRPVFMGSGLAAARRPGMTAYFTLFLQSPLKGGEGFSSVGANRVLLIDDSGQEHLLLLQRVRENHVEIELDPRPLERFRDRRKTADGGDHLLDLGIDIGIARTLLDGDAADRAVLENQDRKGCPAVAPGEEGQRQNVEMAARQGDQVIEV